MPAETINWETVSCPLCGHDGDDDFLRAAGDDGREYRLGQCRHCSFVFLNPRPDEASIGLLYPPDYSPYQPPKKQSRGALRRLRDALIGRGERTLSDRIPVKPGGKLMDYGCGAGAFAAQMRGRGWNAIGMDFSPHAAAIARSHYGLTVVEGTLPHPAVARESLDAITLRMVLEHVHDPHRLLLAASEVVRPGGWLYICVPNLAAWGFRAFGGAWFPLRLPWHLLHFTPTTLRQAVEGAGLVVERIATGGHSNWMGWSIERALRERPATRFRLAKPKLVRSALTRWSRWRGEGDELCLLARKPEVKPMEYRRAA
jgi:2-polyprenyl-3-methyl-5-hydroxy-6-metoxy-1,4-benzoquinol methylase